MPNSRAVYLSLSGVIITPILTFGVKIHIEDKRLVNTFYLDPWIAKLVSATSVIGFSLLAFLIFRALFLGQ